MRALSRLLDFFTSLRLTVACLVYALILIFIGTLAQVDLGLYAAQHKFFRGFFIWWGGWPVMPGGYFLGAILLLNLVAAHLQRFVFSRKHLGIVLIHSGLILMLLGQLLTDQLSTETVIRFREGEIRNFSESTLKTELAFVETSGTEEDQVVAIPESLLATQKRFAPPALPFTVVVKEFFTNSRLQDRTEDSQGSPLAIGAGKSVFARPEPAVTKMDDRNMPSALIELTSSQGTMGIWLVSTNLTQPQSVQVGDKTFQVALRFAREYKTYSLQLLKFTHEKYKGTDIPKNFASRVRLMNPKNHEDREILIYMNSPLRYHGVTYYQASFDPNDPTATVLQAVHNPSWLTPYLSVTLVATGLILQFLSHLISFVKRRRA